MPPMQPCGTILPRLDKATTEAAKSDRAAKKRKRKKFVATRPDPVEEGAADAAKSGHAAKKKKNLWP